MGMNRRNHLDSITESFYSSCLKTWLLGFVPPEKHRWIFIFIFQAICSAHQTISIFFIVWKLTSHLCSSYICISMTSVFLASLIAIKPHPWEWKIKHQSHWKKKTHLFYLRLLQVEVSHWVSSPSGRFFCLHPPGKCHPKTVRYCGPNGLALESLWISPQRRVGFKTDINFAIFIIKG